MVFNISLLPLYLFPLYIQWCVDHKNLHLDNQKLNSVNINSNNKHLKISYNNSGIFTNNNFLSYGLSQPINELTLKCKTNYQLELLFNNNTSYTIISPYLCDSNSLKNTLFYLDYRILDFTEILVQNDRILKENDCSNKNSKKRLMRYLFNDDKKIPLVFVGDSIKVSEGDKVSITWKNFYVFPEHQRFGLKNSEIHFTVIDHPSHGSLQYSNGILANNFSYKDLLENEIFYKHDGSQISRDSFDIQVHLLKKRDDLLNYIDFNQNTLTIHIEIININDPPILELANNEYSIIIPEGSSRLLSTDQLIVFDVDDLNNDIYITLLEAQGVLIQTASSSIITNFTLNQLINHQIFISDDKSDLSYRYIKLQAHDRFSSSNVLTINCLIKKLIFHVIHNTGVSVSHKSYQTITPKNLTYNPSIKDVCDVEYQIIDEPSFGIIECLDDNGTFKKCLKFEQKNIDQGKVRYKHITDGRPLNDTFNFVISCDNITSQTKVFPIEFVPLEINIFNFKPLILNNTEQSYLERSNLVVTTNPQVFQPHELVYYIVEPPKFGILSRKINDKKNRRIGVSSNFTQEHINKELINYKLHFVQYSVVNDYFIFKVLTPTKTSEIKRFDISYIPGGNSIQLVNRIISVEKFGKQQIPKTSLWLETSDDNDFVFTVVVSPKFGKLKINDNTKGLITLKMNNSFSSDDIISGKLYYEHGGFSNSKDDIYLIANSIYKGNSKIPFWLTFHIIETVKSLELLKNEIFEIALQINKERTLYPWMFIKKNTKKLTYKILSKMENFKIISKSNNKKIISSFSNKDLENGHLLIKHSGAKFVEMIKISVNNDFINEIISVKISAKPPSLEIVKNIIKYKLDTRNYFNLVSNENLLSICNLDTDLEEIQYSTLEKNGFHCLEDGQFNEVLKFSQKEINSNKIYYKSSKWPNKIPIEIVCRNIKKLSNVYFEQTKNVTNFSLSKISSLNVFFASIEKITMDVISTNNKDNIVYEIVDFPKYGNIALDIGNYSKTHEYNKESTNQISSSIHSKIEIYKFSPEDLESKNIFYIHKGDNNEIVRDNFSVKVHEKTSTFGPFKIIINIKYPDIQKIPVELFVESNFKKSMQEILQSYYHYSDDNNKVFKIIKQPTKGKIIKEKYLIEQNEFINEFFDDELKRNEVFYSTENSHKVKGRDKFIIRICSTSNKKCELDLEFAIFISSLDVKIPEVLKNERLIVWSNNEPFTITNKHLFVHDEDTPPKDIIFSIAKVINGFVSLSTDILKPIKYFTQDDINSNLIQFTLTQDSTGGFSFTVSDDVDRIEAEWFTVEKVIKNSIVFENNARLFTYPSGREYITVNLLKVAYLNASNNDIIYHISKQPKHGNILLNGQKTNLFTQLDLINKNVIFESTNKYQKHWIVKDYFLFNMSVNGKIFSEVEKFRIAITYALIQQDKQNMFIPTSKMYVSTSGSSILTQSFLNITQIVKYLSKEKLILEIWKPPRFGRIKFFKGSLKSDKIIGDEIFFLDKYIYYENDQKNQKVDDTWFSLCPEKECHKRGSKMKIHLPIEIILPKIKEIKFENFEDLIYINETGIKILNSQNIKVTHTFLSSSNLYFTVNKSSKNTTNIFVDDKRSTTFSQKDIENGIVTLRKSRKFTESFDLLQINIGGHNRVLKVLYQSTEIKFLNQSNIEYYQGKTYVLLNQTHFNVKNLANRENIIYNVTKTPKNGTFYRVDGDKEALTFSQKNIDNGEILYAQVNMNAFQDYFEFSIIYDGNEILKSNSRITIIPTIDYKPFTLEGGTMSNIDINYINASMLSELSPKFYVVSNPLYGKLILNGITPMNESVRFFTFNDILEHRLFYDAYDSKKNIVDNIQIELKGDSIQPARFNFTVNITPTLINSYQKNLNTTKKPHVTETTNSKPLIPKIQSDTDTSNFSVMIAACVIVVIFCIIFCRKSPLKKDESQPQTYQLNVDQNPNFYRSLEALQLSKQIANKNMAPNKVPSTNLLENTVYAKIVEQRLDSTTLSPKVVRKGTTQFELPNEPKKVKILQTFDPTKETSKNDVSNSPYVSFLPKEAVKIHKTNSENNSNSRKLSGNTTLKKDQYWV